MGVEVRRLIFTSIYTFFTYQERVKCAKIYQDSYLWGSMKNPRKYKEKRGYTKL